MYLTAAVDAVRGGPRGDGLPGMGEATVDVRRARLGPAILGVVVVGALVPVIVVDAPVGTAGMFAVR